MDQASLKKDKYIAYLSVFLNFLIVKKSVQVVLVSPASNFSPQEAETHGFAKVPGGPAWHAQTVLSQAVMHGEILLQREEEKVTWSCDSVTCLKFGRSRHLSPQRTMKVNFIPSLVTTLESYQVESLISCHQMVWALSSLHCHTGSWYPG